MNVRLLLTLLVSLLTLASAASASAEDTPSASEYEPPHCGSAEVNSLAALECTPAGETDDVVEPVATLDEAFSRSFVVPEDAGLPPRCRLPANVVFYTSSDWLRLGQKMVADSTRCAEFFVSIPALAACKTCLRVLQDDALRALGPRIHPMAEIHVGGWQAWVAGAPGRTWYDAGVEARRVMAAAGYGTLPGESWAINEFSSAVRRGDGRARQNMRDFVRGLYEGAPGMQPLPGVVFIIGLGQITADTSVYKETLKGWLADSAFWADMSKYVRFWAQEVYPDARNWGVDAPRNTRAEYLNDFLQHIVALAESGPDSIATARDFLRSAYLPLASAAWSWNFGFGWTVIDIGQMQNFVSLQTFAIRHFAGSHPQGAPAERIGFAYAPTTSPQIPAPVMAAGNGLLLDRLASALHHSYDEGGSSQTGACGPPGEHVWCDSSLPGAAFNEAWKLLSSWE